MKKKKVSDLNEQIKSLKKENVELRMRNMMRNNNRNEESESNMIPKKPKFDYLENLIASLKTGQPNQTVNGLHYAILDEDDSRRFKSEENVFNFTSYVKQKSKKPPLLNRLKSWYRMKKEAWKTKVYDWLYNFLNKKRISIDKYLANLSMNLFIHRHKDKIDDMMRVVNAIEKRDRPNIPSFGLVGDRDTADTTWEYKDYDGIVLHKEK